MAMEGRDGGQAMRRGALGRCPACGEGRLFAGYLRVNPECANCGTPLGRYRAADGPAFFTISLVGLLLVPILGFAYVAWRPGPLALALIVTVAVTVLTLVVLRLVKGAFIGWLWAEGEEDRGA